MSAIKGACPAGGCCLSLCCDYRVMTESGHIGLNEVALGIPVPLFWARLMARVIGEGPAHKLCLNAALVSPQHALKLGLVDKVRILPPFTKTKVQGQSLSKSSVRKLLKNW